MKNVRRRISNEAPFADSVISMRIYAKCSTARGSSRRQPDFDIHLLKIEAFHYSCGQNGLILNDLTVLRGRFRWICAMVSQDFYISLSYIGQDSYVEAFHSTVYGKESPTTPSDPPNLI